MGLPFLVMRVFALCTLVFAVRAFTAECPIYTHKDDVKLGAASDLPAGWLVFYKLGENGLFKSDVRSYNATAIPGTASDAPRSIDISDDGKWILYIDNYTEKLYLIRPDGSGRTQVPAEHTQSTFGNYYNYNFSMAGFYRASPFGTEVFWNSTQPELKAVPVTLTGSVPTFGTARSVLNLWKVGGAAYDCEAFFESRVGSQLGVWKDQLFGAMWVSSQPGVVLPSSFRTSFITVPDEGRGTADVSNITTYLNDGFDRVYGCGHTMSHDGKYCLSNSGRIGSDCVPNSKSTPPMDHKGFYITKFIRYDEPKIALDDQINSPEHGVSINWCPPRYRVGTYDEVNFTNWSFSNDSKYVIGSVNGSKLSQYGLNPGLWVIDWSSNTWTQVTPANSTAGVDDPALFFTEFAGVDNPVYDSRTAASTKSRIAAAVSQNGLITVPRRCTGFSLFGANGKLLWTYTSPATSGDRAVRIPTGVSRAAVALVRYHTSEQRARN